MSFDLSATGSAIGALLSANIRTPSRMRTVWGHNERLLLFRGIPRRKRPHRRPAGCPCDHLNLLLRLKHHELSELNKIFLGRQQRRIHHDAGAVRVDISVFFTFVVALSRFVLGVTIPRLVVAVMRGCSQTLQNAPDTRGPFITRTIHDGGTVEKSLQP